MPELSLVPFLEKTNKKAYVEDPDAADFVAWMAQRAADVGLGMGAVEALLAIDALL